MDTTATIPNPYLSPNLVIPRVFTQKRALSQLACKVLRFWHQSMFSLATYLCIVASVSIYDIWLTIEYAPFLPQLEQNPLGRWLMNLDYYRNMSHLGGTPDVTLFVTLKSIGTCLVIGVISWLQTRIRRIGHPVAIGVALFQIGLAYYLTYVNR